MAAYLNGVKGGKPYISGIRHNAYLNGNLMFGRTQQIEILFVDEGDNLIRDEGLFAVSYESVPSE